MPRSRLVENLLPIPKFDADAGPLCFDHPRREELWWPDIKTAEGLADAREAAALCMQCPVVERCREYAEAAMPSGGIWAGVHWTSTKDPHQGKPSGIDLLNG